MAGHNGYIPLFGKICMDLPLFMKYLAIYHLFEIRVATVNSLWISLCWPTISTLPHLSSLVVVFFSLKCLEARGKKRELNQQYNQIYHIWMLSTCITQNELLHFLLVMPRCWKTKIILLRQLSNLSYTNVAQINNSN